VKTPRKNALNRRIKEPRSCRDSEVSKGKRVFFEKSSRGFPGGNVSLRKGWPTRVCVIRPLEKRFNSCDQTIEINRRGGQEMSKGKSRGWI